MKLIHSIADLNAFVDSCKREGLTIGLVPTMGWFHEGHLSLMRLARRKCDRVIVTLFVNPRQFGPAEDLENYPRDLQRDFELAEGTGVDVLFSPEPEEVYPQGYQTNIRVTELAHDLCGASRPGHFDGVATVVTKLFNLTQPDIAVFGEKDFQQLAIIRRLVKDLNFRIKIIGHPIVREPDGVAMSSRNSYLKADERKHATCLYESICYAQESVQNNSTVTPSQSLVRKITEKINSTPCCRVDYVKIVNGITLVSEARVTSDSVLVLAVYINQNIRLIDNAYLISDGE